ncbi:MAG: aminotransferase class III-fold pyridoxal phosphate-dependent enzyme, partial [Bacteroidota bacterium]
LLVCPVKVLGALRHGPGWDKVPDEEKEDRALVEHFYSLIEEEATPLLQKLRKGINYNDAHMHNVLVQKTATDPEVVGVIDFGDALYTHTINELAIACAYACMGKEEPLRAALEMSRGYHEVFPLEKSELAVLYYQIAARLLLTVVHAAENAHKEPDNEYLQVSARPAWDLLRKWRQIHPRFAYLSFCDACGIFSYDKRMHFDEWLEKNKEGLHPVVALEGKTVSYLDLSVGSKALGNHTDFQEITAFNRRIQRMMEDMQVDVGLGGYGEIRPFYSTDAYQVEGNHGMQWRTEHIGFDIWAEAGTAVRAPLDGKIYSFKNNEGERDYGPTIILAHEVSEDFTFYSLYGHLSEESLEGLIVGQQVKKGMEFATIGNFPENGNWPPHLHFQLMLDLLGNEGDFPGVAYPHESQIWKQLCPDPTPFVHKENFPSVPKPLSAEQIREKRERYMGRSLSLTYHKPLHIVRGNMQYLLASDGRRYLDTVNNVAHVGHEHPAVVSAANRQAAVLNTNTRYLHEEIVSFAEELQATFPEELSVVYFMNSGSEANELALRMAQTCSGQRDMLALEVGYHGNTTGTVDVSSYKFDGKGGKGAPTNTHIIPIPDTFRGEYRNPETAGRQYASEAEKLIHAVQAEGRDIAGFIAESIMSCGGQVPLPKNFLEKTYAAVRKAGGLCIADEVQTGFGRVGEHFWSFQLYDVVPDIVTMGKPIGNGHPLGAVITRPEIAEAFSNGMEYFNTFGGNPVSCAIGRAVLRTVQQEGLQQHALELGNYLANGLRELQTRHPIIGDVRGHGLFLGFELIKDVNTLEPAVAAASYLANRMREKGILMSTDGPLHNVLKIKPPMCFSKQNANQLLDYLDRVFKEDRMKG